MRLHTSEPLAAQLTPDEPLSKAERRAAAVKALEVICKNTIAKYRRADRPYQQGSVILTLLSAQLHKHPDIKHRRAAVLIEREIIPRYEARERAYAEGRARTLAYERSPEQVAKRAAEAEAARVASLASEAARVAAGLPFIHLTTVREVESDNCARHIIEYLSTACSSYGEEKPTEWQAVRDPAELRTLKNACLECLKK
jgi:hypothetical protein